MKKTLALALAVVMSLGLLAGCGGGGNTSTPAQSNPGTSQPAASNPAASIPDAPAGGGTVGVCIYKFDDAFMTTYRNALQAQLEEKGYEVTVVDANNDQAQQTEQINTCLLYTSSAPGAALEPRGRGWSRESAAPGPPR